MLSITRRRSLSVADYAALAPAAARIPPAESIRMLRQNLHMTQAQLARRAGMPQSHLARLESGKVNPQLNTLRRVLDALFCEMLVIPGPRRSFDEILQERIREKARLNVARVTGTMALEKQEPDDETVHALLRAEEARLRANPSSEIWSD